MRKLMVLVAMVAMVLVLAAPASAQTFVVNQEVEQFGVVDDSVASQVYNVGVQQVNFGDQVAVAVADADATATAGEFGSATAVAIADADAVNVANAAGISIQTFNFALNW